MEKKYKFSLRQPTRSSRNVGIRSLLLIFVTRLRDISNIFRIQKDGIHINRARKKYPNTLVRVNK
jgi:hypothetical protein